MNRFLRSRAFAVDPVRGFNWLISGDAKRQAANPRTSRTGDCTTN
jgi:hypothetical protein